MRLRRPILVLCACVSSLAAGQERGDLLVATEQITEETFAETVLLLLHYGDEGAIAVAINRPTWVTTRDLFPDLDHTHRYRGPVFHGGPLAQATVLVLSRVAQPDDEGREAVVDGVYMSSDLDSLESLLETTTDSTMLRLYAGHASWGSGQLDEELAAGAWRIVPSNAAMIFDPEPATLWRRLAVSGTEMTVHDAAGAGAPQPPTAALKSRGAGTPPR